MDFIKQPMEIENRSMEIIAPHLVGLGLDEVETKVYSRMIHAAGDVGYAPIIRLSDGVIEKAMEALRGGADIYTDVEMVRTGINKRKLASFGGAAHCLVSDPKIAAEAKKAGITRSMAAMRSFGKALTGSIVAIGNALGYGQSVTTGIVSAKDREIETENGTESGLIQTDAAINPGNSGGALVNADGLVIGINSIKIAREDVEGMCFAIPINTVREIVDQLMTTGRVIRPYLGVGVFDKQTAARAGYQLNVDAGVYVQNVTLDGPAGKAGLQRGDIIVEIGGEKTNTVGDLRAAIASHQVGDVVSVKIIRDGETITLDARLEAIPEQ